MGCGDIDILDSVATSIDERLGKDLLWRILTIDKIVAWQESLVEQAELRAANDCRIHVVVVLVACSIV